MSIVGWYSRRSYRVPACNAHATASERDEFHAIAAAIKAEDDRLRLEYHQALPVACHSWPVTDEHRRLAAEAQACADPGQARHLSWHLLTGWHDGRCAICEARAEFRDHDHETGLVRGWLCHCCNVGEGHGYIPDGQFERYRAKHPTAILGLTIRYYSPFTGWGGTRGRG